jgi:hypothetical protein
VSSETVVVGASAVAMVDTVVMVADTVNTVVVAMVVAIVVAMFATVIETAAVNCSVCLVT